jgi:hypothetical protein
MNIRTPVALFIYKRPAHTEQVLEQIRNANPELLLVIADGPADETDREACQQTRELITESQYPFEVRSNFASTNLGLRERFDTGLEWVFNQTDEAIILEDDTLPQPSFFRFCEEMLEHYRGDNRVWDIGGSNHLGKWNRDEYDYHFSYYGGIWGWATWRESWEEYDANMELWDLMAVRDRIRDVIADDTQYEYVKKLYDETRNGGIETWDYQWGFARHRNNGLSVVPSVNLVENIGFDETATHTANEEHGLSVKETGKLSFPLNHPPFIAPDREYDRQFHELRKRSLPRRALDAIKRRL